MFVVLGLYVKLLKQSTCTKADYIIMLVLAGISFVLGMQGTRSILVLSGPLACIEAARMFVNWVNKKDKGRNKLIFVWTFALLFMGILGTRCNISVGQSLSRNIRKGVHKFITVVLPDAIRCIGFEDASVLEKVFLLFGVGLLAAEVFCIARKGFQKKDISAEDWGMLYLVVSPCMTAVFIAFTTIESSERYYFVFLFAIAFAVVKRLRESIKDCKKVRITANCLITAIFIIRIQTIYLPIIVSGDTVSTPEHEVVEYLAESHYYTAYSTFENANTMTVLSDGNVQVSPVASVEKMNICKWLSSTDWYVPNVPSEAKTAYIVTEAEKDSFDKFLEMHAGDVYFVKQIDKYLIYFSDYNFSCLED